MFHGVFSLGRSSIHRYLRIVLLCLFRMHSCRRGRCHEASTFSDVDSLGWLNDFFFAFNESHFIAGFVIGDVVHKCPDQR